MIRARGAARWAVACTILSVSFLLPTRAQAQGEPSITVTPSSGLTSGQVVSLRGTGYEDISSIAGLECPPEFGGRIEFTISEVLNTCEFISFADDISVDAAGNLTGVGTVQTVINPSSLPTNEYDCTVRNDCVVIVVGLGGSSGLRGATTPISFGPDTPRSKSDCKRGGWRSFGDDQGRPFRNQGQCVRYVVSQRRR